MLCEGGFPLMETDEMNFDILKNVTQSLTANAKFIFTTLNGLFPVFHSVEAFFSSETSLDKGIATYHSNQFDLMTLRDIKTVEVEDDLGNKKLLESNERYYVPSEIFWLLQSLGYRKIEIFGAKLGAFSRNDKLSTTDFEMLVIADKISTNAQSSKQGGFHPLLLTKLYVNLSIHTAFQDVVGN